MSQGDSSQEKTEEATPRKLDKAREDGQIPRSRDLTTTAILLGGTIGLFVFGSAISEVLSDIVRHNFILEREVIFDEEAMIGHLAHSFYEGLMSLMPLFGILLVASIVGPIALGGWLMSAKAMAPKMSRMNPAAGLKRMFGVKALVELGKALAKVLVILMLALVILDTVQDKILALAHQDVRTGVIESLEISAWAAIALAASTILIAIVDIPFQIWDHSKKLKMSMQEVKDEYKDTEGKPEVKGRIRQIQREMANNRMMGDVPDADVVITNPTHFSVALKYKPEEMDTPLLVAKGGDHVAFKIREIAKANKVEVIESAALARSIFYTTDVGDSIPEGLFVAVAQVLAYVFGLRRFRKSGGERPIYPRNVKVPKDMYHD